MSFWPKRKAPDVKPVFKYFAQDPEDKNVWICQVKGVQDEDTNEEPTICGQKIRLGAETKGKGTRSGNLKKHLGRIHPNEYEVCLAEEQGKSSNSTVKHKDVKTQSITHFYQSEKVVINLNKEKFKESLVKMVVFDSIPFHFFNRSEGFQTIVSDTARKLQVSLDRQQIRKYVQDFAAKQRESLKEELKGNLLYLKFDCATRIQTNYLAINVRFLNNGVGQTRTLDVIDTLSRHTAAELKDMLLNTLSKFEISLDKILISVTDNATNMVKLVELCNEDLAPTAEQAESDSEDKDEEVTSGTLDLSNLMLPTMQHMRCAAHTLQLAIHDGLKNTNGKQVLKRARNVAVELRTPKLHEILKKNFKKVAILDQETRWGSSYTMVQRLIDLREAIEHMAACGNEKVKMTPIQWVQLEGMRDILKKAYDTTLKLQFSDITPGYFYRKWSGLKLFYENHGSLLATEIFNSMVRRELQLLNPILMAAVYLDAMHSDLLTKAQVSLAKIAIVKIVIRMNGLSESDEQNSQIDDEVPLESSYSDADSDEDIAALRKRSRLDATSPTSDDNNLPILSTFNDVSDDDELPPPLGDTDDNGVFSPIASSSRIFSRSQSALSRQSSVVSPIAVTPTPVQALKQSLQAAFEKLDLDLPKLAKMKDTASSIERYPVELQEVARLMLVLPVTQVSVERLFSALKIYKSDLRSTLKVDILSDMLVIKANK